MPKLTILVAVLLLFTAGCTKSTQEASSSVYVYASDAKREEFISAFAIEPACQGLTVVTTLTKEPRLHYQGNVVNAPFPPSYSGYIVMPSSDGPSSDIDFMGSTAQDAVRQACTILARKGGTVR